MRHTGTVDSCFDLIRSHQLWFTMSSKHCVWHTGTLDSCFDLVRFYQQYTVISPTGDRTSIYIYISLPKRLWSRREMRISKLGRHDPGGDRVLCMSTDVTTWHIRLDWSRVYNDSLIWNRLCAMLTSGLMVEFRFGILWSLVRSSRGEIMVKTTDATS